MQITLHQIIKDLVDDLGFKLSWQAYDGEDSDAVFSKKDITATVTTQKGNIFTTRIGIFVEHDKFGIYGDHISISWNIIDPNSLDEFQHHLNTKSFNYTQMKRYERDRDYPS